MNKIMCILIMICLYAYGGFGQTVFHKSYVLNYNETYEIANWVTYCIRYQYDKAYRYARSNNFRLDPLITTKSASPLDYLHSGYDRGHLAPANIFKYDEVSMSESFYMSNMIPQPASVNRGLWKQLERYASCMTLFFNKVYVVSGVIVLNPHTIIGKDKVAVPQILYKVIYDNNKRFFKAFVILNYKRTSKNINDYEVSLNFVKAISNINDFDSIINLNK